MKVLKELLVIFSLSFAGEGLSSLLPFPMPGSVIGLFLLLALLLSGALGERPLEHSGKFFLDNMPLFLIPATVSLITVFSVVGRIIWAILAICVITTIVTFAVTAYTAKAVMWVQKSMKRGQCR